MGIPHDVNEASAKIAARSRSGGEQRFKAAPFEITIREHHIDVRLTDEEMEYFAENVLISEKWIYILDRESKEVYAEIKPKKAKIESSGRMEKPYRWHVRYLPSEFNSDFNPDSEYNKASVVVDESKLDEGQYVVFLSPVRASDRSINYIKSHINTFKTLSVSQQYEVSDDEIDQNVPVAVVMDYYAYTEFLSDLYKSSLHKYNGFLSNEKRNNELFIASVVKSWIAEPGSKEIEEWLRNPPNDRADITDPEKIRQELTDPADVKQYLRKSPEQVIGEYTSDERKAREKAEDRMKTLADSVDHPSHQAIDYSVQDGDTEALAVGLLHWGIISECMLCVAPGQVLAHKLMEEGNTLPVTHLFSESQDSNLQDAFTVYKGVHAAGVTIASQLLSAKARVLRQKAGEGRSMPERVRLYLRNLSLETELKGTQRHIYNRLESGDRITRGLRKKGRERQRTLRQYQKLVKKANQRIPLYELQARRQLKNSNRFTRMASTISLRGGAAFVLMQVATLIIAVEDYRSAFPDAKDEKLLTTVGSGTYFYAAVTGLLNELNLGQGYHRWLARTGGIALFVGGVIAMLDTHGGMEEALKRNDVGAAVGLGVQQTGLFAVALSGFMTALTYTSRFGTRFGAVGLWAGVIGAGLYATGVLIVAYFSRNDYQTFARHCFLGKNHGEEVKPDWSTVPFGGGNDLENEVTALYELLYQYKVEFVKTVERKQAVGEFQETYEWSGLKLTIIPGLEHDSNSSYHVDLVLKHSSRHVPYTFTAENIVLSSTDGDSVVHRWSRSEVVDKWIQKYGPDGATNQTKNDIKRLHLHPGEFSLTVQLKVEGEKVGEPKEIEGTTGGKLVTGEYERVEF